MVPENYDDSADAERKENIVAASLPEIPGLTATMSTAERLMVMDAAMFASRTAFVAQWGDPFGCEADVAEQHVAGRPKDAESHVNIYQNFAVSSS